MRPATILLWAAMLAAPVALAEGKPSWAGRQADGQGGSHEHRHPAADGRGREWTAYPLITPAMAGGDRNGATLRVRNLQAPALEVFGPAGPAQQRHRSVPLAPEGARIEAAAPNIGNYHWVTAREEAEDRVTVASTAYFFANPGPAPTGLLLERRNELEIIPQPLPREHGAYRESEKWRFLVRFNGQPLANQEVKMETESGTRTRFISDADGLATVLFPRDFKPAEGAAAGHHGPQRARFVLVTEHQDQGRRYLTAFNYTYSPDADTGRNLWAGAGFGLFGMLLAAPLLRRRTSQTKGEA
jgi:hypothetical protein